MNQTTERLSWLIAVVVAAILFSFFGRGCHQDVAKIKKEIKAELKEEQDKAEKAKELATAKNDVLRLAKDLADTKLNFESVKTELKLAQDAIKAADERTKAAEENARKKLKKEQDQLAKDQEVADSAKKKLDKDKSDFQKARDDFEASKSMAPSLGSLSMASPLFPIEKKFANPRQQELYKQCMEHAILLAEAYISRRTDRANNDERVARDAMENAFGRGENQIERYTSRGSSYHWTTTVYMTEERKNLERKRFNLQWEKKRIAVKEFEAAYVNNSLKEISRYVSINISGIGLFYAADAQMRSRFGAHR